MNEQLNRIYRLLLCRKIEYEVKYFEKGNTGYTIVIARKEGKGAGQVRQVIYLVGSDGR